MASARTSMVRRCSAATSSAWVQVLLRALLFVLQAAHIKAVRTIDYIEDGQKQQGCLPTKKFAGGVHDPCDGRAD